MRSKLRVDEARPGADDPHGIASRDRALLVLFVAALLIRLLYLWQIHGSPQAKVLFGDGEAYDLWAKRIAAGDWLGREAFYQAPLYPYALAVLYRLAGPSLVVVRLVQALLGSAACVLLVGAGARFFGRRAGLAAGALFALYPIAIYSDALIQKTNLESFLLSVLLLCIGRIHAQDAPGPKLWVAAGLTLGALGLVRENTLILAPILVGYAAWPRGRNARLRPIAALLAGIGLVLLPVAVRNLVIGGSFQPTTYQLGTNLYIGNNPAATGMYVPLTEGGGSWRHEREDAVRLAEAAEGRSLTPAGVSHYWTGRAVSFAIHEPGAWLHLMARKTALVWNRVEVGDHESPGLFADVSALLRALLVIWHFGVLCPLAALGMVLTWGTGRRPWILYAMLVALAASVAAFYVFGRYRFSLVPVLVLFAGAGIIELARLIRATPFRGDVAAKAAVAAVLAAVACNATIVSPAAIDANAYYNLGWKLEGEDRGDGDPVAAHRAYERAVTILPGYADAWNNLGIQLAREGRVAESSARFARAVAVDPGHAKAQLNLGKALIVDGKPGEAVSHLEAAVRLRPDDPEARELLAKTFFKLGKPENSLPHYVALVRISPTAANHNNLGSALAAGGRFPDAVREFQAALTIDPAFVEAHDNLALTYLHLGDTEGAALQYREVVRLRPESEQARHNLAQVEARLGSRRR